ncbi:serine palmitoyltransferase small subunit B-like [Teleopsis dalmanni]|uniref:serine palmitoyltransferase small subunit B-like n=1 Tax=Teleopsis dalmanni TaxID=139649 RepID=UPI0018CDE238|nr:serine palmitoyltransferase small subunit B-like [Teleopsis dalmanni]
MEYIKNSLKRLYMHYELVTCIYMFEPWERKLINGFVVLILSLVIFSSCVYLPTYIDTFVQFLSPLPLEAKSASSSQKSYSPVLQPQKMALR